MLANQPQVIRSDEWLVVSQLTIAQRYDHYQCVNPNIGNGENVSVIDAGIPCKDWSAVFQPENIAFFIIPFNYAFAFKWWFMAYALILSVYFFMMAVFPAKKRWAALLSVALFFSPFVQWWYQLATLGPIYCTLILLTLFIYMLRENNRKKQLLIAAGMWYTTTCFALILYPPFMIACLFGALLVGLGFLIEHWKIPPRKELGIRLGLVVGSAILAGIVVSAFLKTRSSAVHALTDTVYPGSRVIAGGGYQVSRLFSGFLDTQLQSATHAVKYGLNQSENSNFILLAPFLFIPSIWLLFKKWGKSRTLDWPLMLVNLALLLIVVRFFSPLLDPLFKVFFLQKVPADRLVIGLGFINLLEICLYLRRAKAEKIKFSNVQVIVYSLVVLLIEAGFTYWTHHDFPGYIGLFKALLLAIVVPVIIYLILRFKITYALVLYLAISIFSTYNVNPLYRGTGPVTGSNIGNAIQNIHNSSPGKWVSEGIHFENFPQLYGVPSISGVYQYPQKSIWKNVSPYKPFIYNRYAHVVFVIDHQADGNLPTHLVLEQNDVFVVATEPCSSFLQKNDVRFILAQAPIDNSCVNLVTTVTYPNQTFFIYHINYRKY
jgi:hypothetical protein